MDIKYDQLPTLSSEQPPVSPQAPVAPAAPVQPQQASAPSPEPPPTVFSTPPPNPSQPPPPKSPSLRISKKLLFIIVGIVVAVLIVLGIVILLSHIFHSAVPGQMSAAKEQQIEAKYKGKDKSADNDYMAQTLLAWVNKTRLSDGRFAFSQICSSATQCQLQAADNRLGPQVAWAEFMYYKKHPSSSLLTQINKDIATYIDESVVSTVQNNFYNCKFMYELWQSNMFTQDQKNNIQTLCTRGQQPPPPVPDESATITDADVVPLMQSIVSNQSVSGTATDTTLIAFTSVIAGVSDLVTGATWFNNDHSYSLALVYFKEALIDYGQNQASFKDASPLLGVAAIDLYKKSGKSSYLTFAENMFLKNNNESCSTLDGCINSIFLARELGSVTGNKDYQYFANGVLRHVGQTEFDGNGFDGYQIGNNAFYSPGSQTIYPVLENTLLLGIYETQ